MAYATTNPYTNAVIAEFPDLDDSELERLVKQAQATFCSWSATPFAERAKIMRRAAAILREARVRTSRRPPWSWEAVMHSWCSLTPTSTSP
jgi:acyl-CoA reductase-like NAD-dependent aldehyde dehydrogenase